MRNLIYRVTLNSTNTLSIGKVLCLDSMSTGEVERLLYGRRHSTWRLFRENKVTNPDVSVIDRRRSIQNQVVI